MNHSLRLVAATSFWFALAAAYGLSSQPIYAKEVPKGLGKQLVMASIAMVTFAEASNLGARDKDCRGTRFAVTEVNAMVDDEIDPVFQLVERVDGRFGPEARSKVIAQIKSFPFARENGVLAVQQTYEDKKREATEAYGKSGRCPALASFFHSGMNQRRQELQSIREILENLR